MADWHTDPNVIQALDILPPTDVMLLVCPKCHKLSYYNQGSSWHCRHCDRGFQVLTEDELIERLEDWNASNRPYVIAEDAISVVDLWDSYATEGDNGQD